MHKPRLTRGYTLFELLVVMAVLGILFTIVALSVKGLHNDADSAASAVASSLLEARTRAFSTTQAIRVTLKDPTTLLFENNDACSKTTGWTTMTTPNPTFEKGVIVKSTTTLALPWTICFTTRGDLLVPAPSSLTVTDTSKHTRNLTVYLTGSVGQ